MSQNQPYDPNENPSTPPSGVPDPYVHGPNADAVEPTPQQQPVNTFDDFERERPSQPYVAPDAPFQPARTDRGGAWIWGMFLIALGVVFLLDNTGLLRLENWWALFILLPAIGSFRSAYAVYKASGDRLTGAARGPLLGGVLLTTLAMIFLFGLNFGQLWPLLLVAAGAALLINALMPN